MYEEADSYCHRRKECYASCIASNFPNLDCNPMKVSLEFDGNAYSNFFYYPPPLTSNPLYDTCVGYIADNYEMPRAGLNQTRAIRGHTCFNFCASYGDCLSGFDLDERQTCQSVGSSETLGKDGILCVDPDLEPCENYIESGMICFGSICFNWHKVIVAMFLANILQIIFEASMLIGLGMSLKPTELDKLSKEQEQEEEQADQADDDKVKELDCSVVASKCCAELVFIITYVLVAAYFFVGIIYQYHYGSLSTVFFEAGVAIVADQLKSLLTQTITYWFVIRRLGQLQPTPEFKNGKWDDNAIFQGGTTPSLFQTLRDSVQRFIER
jgi:hypothetical protein